MTERCGEKQQALGQEQEAESSHLNCKREAGTRKSRGEREERGDKEETMERRQKLRVI